MRDRIATLRSRIGDLERISARCAANLTVSCPDCGGEVERDAPPPTVPDGRESAVIWECVDCNWWKQDEQ